MADFRGFSRRQFAGSFFACSASCDPVDKSVTSDSTNHFASSAASSASNAVEIVRGSPVEVARHRESRRRRRRSPRPCRCGNRATSRSALIAQPPDSEPGETVRIVEPAELAQLAARARPARRAAAPNARAARVREHRRRPQRVAKRPLARPFEHRVGEQQHAARRAAPSRARRDSRRSAPADAPSAAAGPWPARPRRSTLIGTTR